MSCCATAATPTPLLLKPAPGDPLLDSPDARAFVYDASGAVLASVPATYDAEANAMAITTPPLDAPHQSACIRLALDGQTAARKGANVTFYAPLEVRSPSMPFYAPL